MNKWICCARHECGLKNVHVGPEAQNWALLEIPAENITELIQLQTH